MTQYPKFHTPVAQVEEDNLMMFSGLFIGDENERHTKFH